MSVGTLESSAGKSTSQIEVGGKVGSENAMEAAGSLPADKQSSLNAADILNDPKAFAETFARSVSNREQDPASFNKALSDLKEKVSSPKISDDHKMVLLQNLLKNPTNDGSYALEIAINGAGVIKDLDVVTSSGRHDLVDSVEGQSVDKMQLVVDSVYQSMNLTLDKAIVKDPSKTEMALESKLQSVEEAVDAFAPAVRSPEIAKSFADDLEKAIKHLPDDVKMAAREFANLVTGDHKQRASNLTNILEDMNNADLRDGDEKSNKLAMYISSASSFSLTDEQKAERKAASAVLASRTDDVSRVYEAYVNAEKKELAGFKSK